MKFTQKQLMEMTISFHAGLYTLNEDELTRILNLFDPEKTMIFLSWMPPIFYQQGDSRFTAVGRHLSFCMMSKRIKQSTEVQIITKDDNLPALIKEYSALDQKLYSALLEGDAPSYEGVSRPTLIKRRRLEKGQVCPFCKGTAALIAEENWRSQVKDGQGGKLKCPQCDATATVTAEELKKFQSYDLRTDELKLSRWDRSSTPSVH